MGGGSLLVGPGVVPHVLDNATISSLHLANALEQLLAFWPGRCIVPLEVRSEAAAWPGQGTLVVRTLDDLAARGIVALTALDPRVEGPLYAVLNRTLGAGESAVIAIASHRRYHAVLDDRIARRACDRLSPPVRWIATEDLLKLAVTEGRLTLDEARAIWRATGIVDPKRQIT